MTGTGTKTDPYIVDNWEDLSNAVKNAGAYIEVFKRTVIDLEKLSTKPTEYTLSIRENVTINGNDAVIKNGKLKINADQAGKGSIRFSDFNFIDIITESQFINAKADSSSASWNFTRCECKVFGAGETDFIRIRGYYAGVSFNSCNITYINPNGRYYYNTENGFNLLTHNYCNLHLNCKYLHTGYGNTKAPDFVSCYLAGEFLDAAPIKIDSYRINYSILEIKGNYYVSPYHEGKGNVINSELTSNRSSSSSAVTYLATEEIRDPQKLNKAGLLIDPTGG